MLASYILMNCSSDKDGKDNQSSNASINTPTPSEFEGKPMVSLLKTRKFTTDATPSGKTIVGQNQTPIQTRQANKNATGKKDSSKQNSGKTRKKETVSNEQRKENDKEINDLDDLGNDDSNDESIEELYKAPSTIFSANKTIELIKCTDKTCDCRAIHCPFCLPKHFKPTLPSRVRDHLENKHFSHAVQYEDLVMVKCYQPCFGKKQGHYHCPICLEATFLKRIGFTKHLISHAHKENKDPSIVSVPDVKHPSTVSINDYEIDLCTQNCKDDKSKGPHYHCPLCESFQLDRKSLILHLWRCETSSSKQVKGEKTPSVEEKRLDRAYNIQSDLPPSQENNELIGHFSIVRSLADLSHEKCKEENCCGGKYHCILCTSLRFKPTYHRKLQRHFLCHWGRRVQCKGYFALPCYSDCEVKDDVTLKARFHFHCPVCGGTRRRRDCFIHHLKICQGKGKSVKRIPFDKSSRQEMSLGDVKLEAVDDMEEDELNDAMPAENVDEEDNDDLNDIQELDLFNETDDADQVETEQEVDLQNIKLFSSVTAEISKQLVKEAEKRGLDHIFDDVSDLTGVSYLVSPGITSPVHSLHGDMKALSLASLLIQQKLGIEDHDRAEKGTNTEEEFEDLDDSLDFNPDIDVDIPAKTRGRKRGRKKGSTNENSKLIPGKKVKVEPLDHAYESPQNTPGRRYSTRGVRMDFSKLLAGKNREEAALDRDSGANDLEDDEDTSSRKNKNKKTEPGIISKKMALKSSKAVLVPPKTKKKCVELEDENDDEESDEKENIDESRDDQDQDYSVNNESSIDNGEGVSSASMRFFMNRFNLSNIATIPRVSFGQESSKSGSNFTGKRRCYSVVNKYRCTKCEFTCENFKECSEHLINVHEKNPELRCDVCERHFDKHHHLKLHLETKHGPQLETKQYSCPHCKISYVSKFALDLHIDSKHNNPKRPKFACRRCDFVGEDRHDLEVHVQANHFHLFSGELCTICGKTFRNKNFLEQHTQNVHSQEEAVRCKVCHKAFPRRRSLMNHMSVHNLPKEHVCPTCGKKFHRKGNLQTHMETHKRPEDRTYRYSCKYCGQKVNSKANYLEHLNKHTGNRPFLCEICGKSFAYRTAVYKHKIFIHSSETPFKCNTCGKKFKTKHLLNQHMTLHTGMSTYKCDTCEKTFTTASSLKIHKSKCKAVPLLQQLGGNLVIFTNPDGTRSQMVVSDGETIIQNNLNVALDNSVTTTTTTEVAETAIVYETQETVTMVTESKTGTESEAQTETQEAPEVALYLCSECNAAFQDFEQAEQHVLMGHEPAVSQATSSLNEAVNVILKDMPEST